MNPERVDEELLRELACLGDLHQIRTLLTNKPNLNINSQNVMNGWTALHWAAKRNHSDIVGYLLENGADRDIQAHDQSTPAHVCTDDSLRKILQSTTSDNDVSSSSINQSTLPIIPNYLRNPIFPYISSALPTPNPTINDNQTITLLCRIADDPAETDFVELDFQKCPNTGSYDRLLSLICEEFNLLHIDKLRRLPCIRIRNDRDVERLKDNQILTIAYLSLSLAQLEAIDQHKSMFSLSTTSDKSIMDHISIKTKSLAEYFLPSLPSMNVKDINNQHVSKISD